MLKIINKRSVLLCTLLFNCAVAQEQIQTIEVNANDNTSKDIKYKNTSKTTINKETLENLAKGNGNISDFVKHLPNVKLDENANSSYQAGEIKPDEFEISGGKFFNNKFLIDGTSISSLLDPASSNHNSYTNIPGSSQEFYINTDLLESIDVYDSDISAKYGGFTGGVVDAKTKHAQLEFKGKVSYRHTSDKVTQFHVENKAAFQNAAGSSVQPKFKKNKYGVYVNTPITDDSAMFIDISRSDSEIPLKYFDGQKAEKRVNQNYLAKYSNYINDNHIVDVSLNYSPYEENRFVTNQLNSDFTIKGGGALARVNHEYEGKDYKVKSKLSYSHSVNEKDAEESNVYTWGSGSTFKEGYLIDKETIITGNSGDLEKSQRTTTLKSDLTLNKKDYKYFSSILETGLELSNIYGNFERKDQNAIYKVASNETSTHPKVGTANLICNGLDGCIDGDQYAAGKDVYEPFKTTADMNQISYYLTNEFETKNSLTNLGFRYDYNNLLQNHDIAYRFNTKYDIFDKTYLTLGANRYYASTFLTYKLRENQTGLVSYSRPLSGYIVGGQQYQTPGAWEKDLSGIKYNTEFSSLDTPYTDEQTIGLEKNIFGIDARFKYIHRKGKDELSRKTSELQNNGYKTKYLTNRGSSSYNSYKIELEKRFDNHYFMINYTKAKGKHSNKSYDDLIIDSEPTEIYYNGDFVSLDEIAVKKSEVPHTIKMIYLAEITPNFSASLAGKYTSDYTKFGKTIRSETYSSYNADQDVTTYSNRAVYDNIKYKAIAKFDLSLMYKYKKMDFKVDVNNVFNTKQKMSAETNQYKLGRQFWFEMAMNF